MRRDEILCCLAILRMVVCCIFCLIENPQDDPQTTNHKGLKTTHKTKAKDKLIA